MHSVRRILVAVKDPRSKLLPAVMKAAQLARAWGAELELFHGITTTVYTDIGRVQNGNLMAIEREMRAQHRQPLERIATRLRKHAIKVTISAECDFPVYEAIVRRARLIKADLIVAECHAGRRGAPWLLQLTDWELLQKSPLPVLLVKSSRPYRRPVVLAAIDPTHAFSKPTRLDEEILRNGAALERALRGTLHAVHAYLSLPLYLKGDLTNVGAVTEIEEAAAARATKLFERAVKTAHLPRARRHLIEQSALQAIPAVARRIGSAIVVMGAISRSGLKRAFIGNTAERVLNDLTCDVLVVKPRGFKSPVPRASRGARLIAMGGYMF
ncbi:MAG TPA: universal stress protein [Gemmatimonadaceae bacterium]